MLWPFGSLVAFLYISPRFGLLCQEKSGNHAIGSVKIRWNHLNFFVLCRNQSPVVTRRGLCGTLFNAQEQQYKNGDGW
jgi:hypothetical protein